MKASPRDSAGGILNAPPLRIVVGLGNPGAKYAGTRHNVGFDVLDRLATELNAPPPRAKHDGQITTATVGDSTLVLVWPLTYMNLSGRCAQAVARFYKIDVQQQLMVICDDLSLPLGKLRVRARGSAGGQKGLKHILQVFQTEEIARLRIGIDPPPPQWDAADYVLARLRPSERPVIEQSVASAADAVLDWCRHGIDYCMNRVNGRTT